jgi:signal peptidase
MTDSPTVTGVHSRPEEKPNVVVLIVTRACSVLFYAIVLAIILCVGTLLVGQMLGFKPLAILSGSMEPNYSVYGLVVVDTNVTPEQVAVGDVVAFQISSETTVTHRVIDIDEGSRLFSTKGDANDAADLSPVPFDRLIGRAGLYVPLIGYLLMNLRTTAGLAVGLIALAVLIVLFAVPAFLTPERRAGRKRAHAARSQRFKTSSPAGTSQTGEVAKR